MGPIYNKKQTVISPKNWEDLDRDVVKWIL